MNLNLFDKNGSGILKPCAPLKLFLKSRVIEYDEFSFLEPKEVLVCLAISSFRLLDSPFAHPVDSEGIIVRFSFLDVILSFSPDSRVVLR